METLNIQMQPFFEWLLRTTLQASLLICLILSLQTILHNRLGVRWHYGLWLLLLLRMAMPWTLESRASLFNLLPRSIPQRQFEHDKAQAGDESADSIVVSAETSEPTPISDRTVAQKKPKVVTVTPQPTKEVQGPAKATFPKFVAMLPLAWVAGALVLGVYVCASNLNFLRIVRLRRPVTDQKILDLLEDCKSRMGIRTILGVVITNKVKSPALFGFVRPRLLLPEGMIETLSEQELRYVLLHELAHLKRHDIYTGWLASLLQVLHWFNPFVWLAFYRMRSDRELACDALVLARTHSDEPKSYGRIIVSLLERFSRPRPLPGLAGILETKSQLKRRITMIAQFKKNSYQWSPLAIILIIILGCVSLPDAISTKASQTSFAKPPAVVVRQVWARAGLVCSGEPSPDGKYLSYVDWETGDLAVRELATGTNHRLTKEGYDKGYALSSVFSRDGKQVAYIWYNKDKFYELRTISLDGSEPRVLYRNRDARSETYAWSPDGKHILTAMSRQDGASQMALIGVSDGSVRVLKGIWPRQADFSPDGRFIVYDNWNEIHVLGTDGSGETTLIDHPAAEQLLGWSPDDEWILFASDRRGTWDAWAVQISDGKPQGPAELVKLNIGQVFPMGFTHDGSFYYTVWSGKLSNVYTATIDVQAGEVFTKPANITRHRTAENTFAGWSPDGKWVAYFSRPYDKIPPRSTIVIRNVETNEEREINPKIKLVHATGGRWSPDGHFLLLVGRQDQKGQGIYQIDVQSGEVTPLVGPGRQEPVCPVWSSDGKAIYYIQRADEPERILVRDLQTNREREVARGFTGAPWLGMALSPDGQHLAFFAGEAKQSFVLRTVTVGEGETRELFRVQQPEFIRGAPAWSLDGRQLLVIDRSADQKTHTLWRVSAEDGKAQKFNLAMWRLSHVHMHPDGKQIAFSAHGAQSAKSEVWVMENFLPQSLGK